MLKVGFIGWRGMVGSVLMARMLECNDFVSIDAHFFSTSNIGGELPAELKRYSKSHKLLDAYDTNALQKLDVIVSLFGSDYTNEMLSKLRATGYTGYFLDASSALRMNKDTIIVLDPINRDLIDKSLGLGIKNYAGGNCTVSLMLMGVAGLFQHDLVEWISSMTYQAASGAGANNMRELLIQNWQMYNSAKDLLDDPKSNILEINKKTNEILNSDSLSKEYFGYPLAGNVLPWIDVAVENGQTKEEWKVIAETNKILGLEPETIKVDGICVRVSSMRCHSQALTIKLKDKDLSLEKISEIIKNGNEWVRFVDNNKIDTLSKLTPAAINGSLEIGVGRLKRMNIGSEYISLFTVGDQLLWGAAEPIRRMLNILVDYHG